MHGYDKISPIRCFLSSKTEQLNKYNYGRGQSRIQVLVPSRINYVLKYQSVNAFKMVWVKNSHFESERELIILLIFTIVDDDVQCVEKRRSVKIR